MIEFKYRIWEERGEVRFTVSVVGWEDAIRDRDYRREDLLERGGDAMREVAFGCYVDRFRAHGAVEPLWAVKPRHWRAAKRLCLEIIADAQLLLPALQTEDDADWQKP